MKRQKPWRCQEKLSAERLGWSPQRTAGDTLEAQRWQPTAGLGETGHHLTIVLECFHLVNLLRILSKLMQENKFLQQNWLLSPASCKAEKEKRNPNGSVQQHRHRDILVQKVFIFTICRSLISNGKWAAELPPRLGCHHAAEKPTDSGKNHCERLRCNQRLNLHFGLE